MKKSRGTSSLSLELRGSIIIWHLLNGVPMIRKVHDGNSRDLPGSSFKVPVNCGHNVTLVLSYSVLNSHLHRFLWVCMVIVHILDPWRSLEALDTSAPISQFQPSPSQLYKVYTLGIETVHH